MKKKNEILVHFNDMPALIRWFVSKPTANLVLNQVYSTQADIVQQWKIERQIKNLLGN